MQSKPQVLMFLFAAVLSMRVHSEGPASTLAVAKGNAVDKNHKVVLAILETTKTSSGLHCEAVARLLKARFSVRNTDCAPSFMFASNPPKRRLAFTLRSTRYVMYLPMYGAPAKIVSLGATSR